MAPRRRLLALAVWMATCSTGAVTGQEPSARPERAGLEPPTISAVVNADRSVTFTLRSDHAEQVEIGGDFRFGRKVVGREAMGNEATGSVPSVPMTRTGNVWAITSEPVSPMIYRYFFVVDGTTTPTRTVDVAGQEAMPWDLLDIPHGTVVIDKLHSEALKQVKTCVVYLPPGYGSSTKSYPVLYLLHGGGGGDSLEWVSEGHADNIMDYLISRGRAREMILVMPDRALLPSAEKKRLDSLSGNDLEAALAARDRLRSQYLTGEVMSFIESKYRVSKDQISIAGLSGGAGETFQFVTSHPGRFVAAGIFSGSVGMGRSADYEPFLTRFKETLAANRDHLGRLALLYVACGDYDPQLGPVRAMHGALEELAIPHVYVEGEGAHNWPFWSRSLVDFVSRLSQAQAVTR